MLEGSPIDFYPLPIKTAGKPMTISINYNWIIEQLDKRLGKCPDEVKDALIDMQAEESKELI